MKKKLRKDGKNKSQFLTISLWLVCYTISSFATDDGPFEGQSTEITGVTKWCGNFWTTNIAYCTFKKVMAFPSYESSEQLMLSGSGCFSALEWFWQS